MGEIHKQSHHSQLIMAIKTNDSIALKAFYISNYQKVESLVLSNNGTKEHAKDIFQEAFIAIWENIKNDKFMSNSVSEIQGYLYKVSRNKWIDTLRSRQHKKTIYAADFLYNNMDETDSDIETTKDEQLEQVMHAFENLQEPCKKLLSSFYFEKLSMNSIAEIFNLDAASARNKKYRCMQKLSELVQNTSF